MTVLAVLRAHNTIVPLFLHIGGAMVLVGALALASVYLIGSWRSGSVALIRSAYLTLFYAALPGYIVFRIGAAWIADKEGLTDVNNVSWLDIGYTVSDFGALLLIISLVIGGISIRSMNRSGVASPVAARIVTGLVSLVLIAYLVAVWAMTTKPT
jgi:hypothetical protein